MDITKEDLELAARFSAIEQKALGFEDNPWAYWAQKKVTGEPGSKERLRSFYGLSATTL